MHDKSIVTNNQGPQSVGAILESEQYPARVRQIAGTILGTLVFAAALLLADMSHLRMPGHIVVFWFPALMAGRALSGYTGSGLIISAAGCGMVNLYHPAAGADVFGFALAAVVVEGIMALARQNPSALLGISMAIAAVLGKMLPKVAIILTGSATPHHNRVTLPGMLASYIVFGTLAGVIYVGARYLKRKMGPRFEVPSREDDSGSALVGLLVCVSILGILVTLHG